MAMTGQQFTISAGRHEATIVEVGAGLRRYAHGGVDVTCGYGKHVLPPKGCGAVLVPWPNRLRGGRYTFDSAPQQLSLSEPAAGNAIHGLGRWVRWTPVRHAASEVSLALDVVPQTGYPFELRVEVTYALDDDGLSVTTSAHNTGAGRAPFGAGFHPYLSVGGAALQDTVVTVPAATRLIVDDRQIPIGSEPVHGTPYDLREARPLGALRMDDCFTDLASADGRGRAEVRSPAGGAALWFDETFGYLQAYTLEQFPGTVAPAIALEPMTCAPDAFNSGAGLNVLEAGATWTGSWGIAPL
ncbi:MAG: aldose 1-epimerase family protein [Jatrophihabitantaceae bacterium]